jgi:hypothetical protein
MVPGESRGARTGRDPRFQQAIAGVVVSHALPEFKRHGIVRWAYFAIASVGFDLVDLDAVHLARNHELADRAVVTRFRQQGAVWKLLGRSGIDVRKSPRKASYRASVALARPIPVQCARDGLKCVRTLKGCLEVGRFSRADIGVMIGAIDDDMIDSKACLVG